MATTSYLPQPLSSLLHDCQRISIRQLSALWLRRLLPVLMVLVPASILSAADWPTYRHDNRRSGLTKENIDVKTLGLSWQWHSPLPPQPAWAGPAKWDAYAGIRGLKSMRMYDPVFHVISAKGRAYFGSTADDSVHCLDAKTGKELWRYTTDGPVRIAPTYYSGRLYFGSDDGHAYCLNATTGQLRWKFNPSRHAGQATTTNNHTHRIVHNGRFIPFWPCRSGLLVQNGTAYFSASLFPWHPSYLCAVDAINGSITGKGCYLKTLPGQTMEGAMVASEEQLIVPQGRVAPQLFKRTDGSALGPLKGGGGSFVVLGEDATIFHGPGNKQGWITSSQSANRKTVATFKAGNVIVVRGGISFLLTDTDLVASDYVNRKVLWRRECSQPYDLIGVGETLFAGGTDEIAAYHMSTGKQLWRYPVEGKVFGLSFAGGQLIASTDVGHIYAFRPGGLPPKQIASAEPAEASDSTPSNLTPITPLKDESLLGRWVFQRPHLEKRKALDLAGKLDATIEGNLRLATVQSHQALVLDGKTNRVMIRENHQDTKQPVRQMTVEAWVRIEQPLTWGGIVGAIQDNGAYERGWLLGYRKSNFTFALASKDGPGNMTYLDASDGFTLGQWYHVAGTYDGTVQRIYVNGRLAGSSPVQKGDINYPPKAFYEIGAYHDSNENYPAQGMVHEVRVYRRVLTAAELLRNHRAKSLQSTPDVELAAGPALQFVSPSEAIVEWETVAPSPTSLTYGIDDTFRTISKSQLTRKHRVRLTNLKRHRLYNYTIQIRRGKESLSTVQFECDTFFNYQRFPAGSPKPPVNSAAATILKHNSFPRGLCLVMGVNDGALLQQLAEGSHLHVIGFSTDPNAVSKARDRLYAAGLYGTRASVMLVSSLRQLPITRCCANVAVVVKEKGQVSDANEIAELHRILRPQGIGLLAITAVPKARPFSPEVLAFLEESKISHQQSSANGLSWLKFRRPTLPGSGNWSHLYGSADNSAFGGETLQNVSSTDDLVVQWIGRPGPRYQPDRNGRKPSPLSVNGRLFLQGLQRLVALDSYNGTVLWSFEIPSLGRFNMPRDCGNWSADDDYLYVAIEDRLWQIDALTGQVVHQHQVPLGPNSEWDYEWGYIANVGDSILGSSVKKGTAFRSFWGGASDGWYDAKSGKATAKVCSDQLFSLNKADHSMNWRYRGGIILNSTITATSDHLYFVENRNPAVKKLPQRRVADAGLWKENYLVALDLSTGTKIWEKPLQTTPGTVVFYLAHGNGTLALVSSSTKRYDIYAYQSTTGQPVWDTHFPWTKDNHGGHMSRPAIVGNTLYVRPRVFELDSGSHRDLKIPGGGCGTYACTTGALFFRSGNVTVWDRLEGKTTKWSRLRPDCWLSTIPAGGMLLSPEGGGGCSCGSWLETSLGFIPKAKTK